MRSLVGVLGLALAQPLPICLAQAAPDPAFDVASVKLDILASRPRSRGEPSREAGPECRGDRFVSQAVLLRRLIA